MPVIQWKWNGSTVVGKGSNEETGAWLVVSVRSVSNFVATSSFRIDVAFVRRLDAESISLFLRISATFVLRPNTNLQQHHSVE